MIEPGLDVERRDRRRVTVRELEERVDAALLVAQQVRAAIPFPGRGGGPEPDRATQSRVVR